MFLVKNSKIFFVTLFLGILSCTNSNNKVTNGKASKAITTSSDSSTSTSITTTTTDITKSSISFNDGPSVDFGTILVGLTVEKTLTLSNASSGSANSLSASLTSPFAFKGGTYPGTGGTCSTSLAKNTSCTIVLTFSSLTAASNSLTFKVNYNNGVSIQTISITLSATAVKLSQKQKLVGSGTNGRNASDGFGQSISIFNDTIVVGANGQSYDQNGANSVSMAGAAYVFVKSGSNWVLQQKLVGQGTNGRVVNDYFGLSVAIHNNTIAVGAPSQDTDQNGANSVADSGAVFVFTRSGTVWTFQQKLIGQGANGRVASDQFGISVAAYEDTIVVGAMQQDYDEVGGVSVADAGAAFVFTRAIGVWSLQQKLVGLGTNGRGASDYFGYSVSLYSNTLAIGAMGHSYDEFGATNVAFAGAVFVFVRSGTTWSLQQKLVGLGSNGRKGADDFGVSVSLYKDTLAIGAYGQDYDENGGANVSNAGAVFVFVRSGATWTFQQKLVSSGSNGRLVSDFMAYSVSLYEDTIVAGAYQQDYDENGANLLSNAGAAYVFTRSGSTWTFLQKIAGQGTNGRLASDNFGYCVTVYNKTVASCAYAHGYDENGANNLAGAGAAYVWDF